MSKVCSLTVRLRPTWWLRGYLFTLILLCELTGLEPDPARVGYWIAKGMRFELEPNSPSEADA